ncbi:sensor histidine kinase [Sedimenticola sp.]|uniref:sensor histidine kinase n=1 Tax=Sedimenticola sp. TaxID=1940285 RepID=UPI003D0BC322
MLLQDDNDDQLFTARPLAYAGAVVIVLISVSLSFLLHRLMPHANLSLLFLTGVLIISARTGLGPSLVASVLSFLAFNFFFTPPYYTFEVADDGDVATLIFFLLMAAITGNLAARMHQEMIKRRLSLRRISNLYEFSRRMSSATDSQEVLNTLVNHFARSHHCAAAVYLPDNRSAPVQRAGSGPEDKLPDLDIEQAWSTASIDPVMQDAWQLLPLITDRERVGLLTVHSGEMDSEQLQLSRSLCEQAAVALHRTQLVADLEQARLVSETEQLRSALLSSVSHDLRTPLASIIGSTTSLLEYGDSFSNENRTELLRTVVEEAQRLDRHIQNLLDMTRLGQGTLSLRRDWVDLHDIVSSAVERMRDTLKGWPLKIDIAPDVPLLWVHGVLIEQALVNLLDNALRFSPVDGQISLTARYVDDRVEIRLCDEGPGIPPDEREKIFDMFYTARQGDRGNLHGTGLGLAIVRGMIVAHGGTVTAHGGDRGRGTCMQIRLPVGQSENGES